jgi:hypothetical protein
MHYSYRLLAFYFLVIMLVWAVLMAIVTVAGAHSWYDWDCCSKDDCFEVAREDVVEIEGGWKYLPTGNEFKDPKKIRLSRDGKFHVCIMGTTSMCIYIEQGS